MRTEMIQQAIQRLDSPEADDAFLNYVAQPDSAEHRRKVESVRAWITEGLTEDERIEAHRLAIQRFAP